MPSRIQIKIIKNNDIELKKNTSVDIYVNCIETPSFSGYWYWIRPIFIDGPRSGSETTIYLKISTSVESLTYDLLCGITGTSDLSSVKNITLRIR
jgi:hypothetical protein